MGNTLLRQDTQAWNRMEKAGLINQVAAMRKRGLDKPSIQEWRTLFESIRKPLQQKAAKDLIEVDMVKLFKYMLDYFEIPPDITPTMMVGLLFQPIMMARQVFPDVHDCLYRLGERRIPAGLVSNTMVPSALCRSALERLNILHHFQFTFFSSEYIYRKPHAAMFRLALQRTGMKPNQVLYVGDQLVDDVEGAARVGMKTAWLNRSGRRFTGRRKPNLSLQSLADLPDALS